MTLNKRKDKTALVTLILLKMYDDKIVVI